MIGNRIDYGISLIKNVETTTPSKKSKKSTIQMADSKKQI